MSRARFLEVEFNFLHEQQCTSVELSNEQGTHVYLLTILGVIYILSMHLAIKVVACRTAGDDGELGGLRLHQGEELGGSEVEAEGVSRVQFTESAEEGATFDDPAEGGAGGGGAGERGRGGQAEEDLLQDFVDEVRRRRGHGGGVGGRG